MNVDQGAIEKCHEVQCNPLTMSKEANSTPSRPPKIIPYNKSEIVVEKHGGKKTAASIFCSSTKRPNKKRPRTGGSVSSSSLVTAEDSNEDASDSVSVLSDLSDISVMSFQRQFEHLPSSCSAVAHKYVGHQVLPRVHGYQPKQKVQKNPNIPMIQLPQRAVDNCSNFHRDSNKEEVDRLREDNFQLRRSNVNLKSQVESLQQLRLRDVDADCAKIVYTLGAKTSEQEKILELKKVLRSSQDEIISLKTEMTRTSLDREGKVAEIAKLQNQLRDVQASAGITSLKSDEEIISRMHSLESDLKTAKRSQEWYEEQLKVAQAARESLQCELVKAQKENCAKSQTVVKLQCQTEELRELLTQEKVRTAGDREQFVEKLRKIESEMKDQEAQLDHIQGVKDRMIEELSQKLGTKEEEENLVQEVRQLEREVAGLAKQLEAKDEDLRLAQLRVESVQREKEATLVQNEEAVALVEELQFSLDQLQKESRETEEELSGQIKELRQKLESIKTHCEAMTVENNDKSKMIKAQEDEVEDVKMKEKQLRSDFTVLQDSLKNIQLSNDTLIKELHQARSVIAGLENDLSTSQKSLQVLQNNVEDAKSANTQLQLENENLIQQLRNCPTPDPSIQVLKEDITELKRQIMRLEQFENEAAELTQERIMLQEAKDKLADKLIESEKFFEAQVDELRKAILTKDELIDAMRHDIEAVEQDLSETKDMLETISGEKEVISTESCKRMEDLEGALEDYGDLRKKLADTRCSLAEASDRIKELEDENESVVGRFQKVLTRVEAVESENATLSAELEEAAAGEAETKALHLQRVARLEAFVAEYEREVAQLTAERSLLQDQIISLEDANGRLAAEGTTNHALREQLSRLQQDLVEDTNLRQELVKGIEVAKENLTAEIASLEVALAQEKKDHAATKELWLKEEHKSAELFKELETLKTKYQELMSNKQEDNQGRLQELQALLEDQRRLVVSQEDHLSTLKFQLSQRETELAEAKSVLDVSKEKYDGTIERLRQTQEAMRRDIAERAKHTEALAEERNSYRTQVQQMNLALRTSLKHIKHLRSKTNSSHPSISQDPLEDDGVIFNQQCAGGGISSLQSCLASLRAEMALLQEKLAPPGGRRSVTPSSGSSPSQSPLKNKSSIPN